MATIKKPVKSKSTTAKKPVAKAPAAKAPAAKKLAVKKPAAKKPAVKKATVKKPAAKAAVKKPAAKKPAAKPAVKKPAAKPAAKPAVKKSAVKSAVKPAAKTAVKPAAVKKPEAAKSAAVKKPAVKITDNVKFRNLFEAYSQEKLPFAHGYIISSFFDQNSAYSIYEIVSYAGVKEIFPSSAGLQFISGGKKLHILVEPDTYPKKFIEPVSRAEGEKIPKRFNELDTIIAKNQTKIYISKAADETPGSFTILTPKGMNFSVVFYELPDMYATIADFFTNSLNRQRKVPEIDAKKAAQMIVKTVEKEMNFKGDFE